MRCQLDMIGLVVEDIAASVAFYRTLGMEIPALDTSEPYAEVELRGGIRLSWNTVAMMREIQGHWDPPVGHRMGLAFLYDSPADVDAAFATVVAAGYSGVKEPWDAFWGQRYAQIVDPDGNLVDLFAPL